MRNAASLALILLVAACSSPASEPDNVAANGPVEVEALPADESAATPSDELQNGVNEPDAANLSNQH